MVKHVSSDSLELHLLTQILKEGDEMHPSQQKVDVCLQSKPLTARAQMTHMSSSQGLQNQACNKVEVEEKLPVCSILG